MAMSGRRRGAPDAHSGRKPVDVVPVTPVMG